MGRIIILNGSPRAPKSNSKGYAEIFSKYAGASSEYYNIYKINHNELCTKLKDFSDILLVFPLYADGIPVTLLNFLKKLEKHPPFNRPTVSILVNCGFFEPEQNDISVEMIRLFCRQNQFPFGSVLCIGSGEAILGTPFKVLAAAKIKKLSTSIRQRKYQTLYVTMPLSKKTYVKASVSYWVNYGRKNGVTKEQMESMKIE